MERDMLVGGGALLGTMVHGGSGLRGTGFTILCNPVEGPGARMLFHPVPYRTRGCASPWLGVPIGRLGLPRRGDCALVIFLGGEASGG